MKTKKWFLIPLLLAILVVWSSVSADTTAREDRGLLSLNRVRAAIQARGAGWQAGNTSISALAPDQRRTRVGTRRPTTVNPERVLRFATAATPASLDWRNHKGSNFISSVRDQGSCGSCWAFAVVANIESIYNVERSLTALARGLPGFNYELDLSEQFLVSCSGAGDCAEGGWSDLAAEYVKTDGIAREEYFSYLQADVPCGPQNTWVDEIVGIDDWGWVTLDVADREAIYAALQNGPINAYLTIYSDFYYYVSGIYEYTSGGVEGGHQVLIVGYSKAGGYWICKNSWGVNWGENGYFRIKMGQADIGSWALTVWGVGTPDTFPPSNLTGERAENKSLLQSEQINILRWSANPANGGAGVVGYRIYLQADNQWVLLGQVDGGVTEYWQRGVDRLGQQSYAVAPLLANGLEAPAGYVTIQ